MKIYIPSHNRANLQTTWHSLPTSIQATTKIVVYDDEVANYSGFPLEIIPPNHPKGIWHKRQYLLDVCPNNHMMMIDDDLVFATRRTDDPTRFIPSTDADMLEMFIAVEDMLMDNVIHGAIATREGGNRFTGEFKRNGRALRAHFYNVGALRKLGVRFDRTTFMQDFDMTLQLLRLGKPNVILNKWVQNQKGSNSQGGCSHTRTPDKHAEAAHKLHELHPDFVTVVKKETKSAWGGGERTDVRVQWKRCYEASQ